jgi:hypothetical protein
MPSRSARFLSLVVTAPACGLLAWGCLTGNLGPGPIDLSADAAPADASVDGLARDDTSAEATPDAGDGSDARDAQDPQDAPEVPADADAATPLDPFAMPPPVGVQVLRDSPGATWAAATTAGTRERAYLQWNVPGATEVALEGVGELVTLFEPGTPRWDDWTLASVSTETPPTFEGAVWRFRENVIVSYPYASASVLGETWRPFGQQIRISPRGILTRKSASDERLTGLGELNSTIPPPGDSSFAITAIAPLWSNVLVPAGEGSRIWHGRFDKDGPADRFVVEWQDFVLADSAGRVVPVHFDFQAAIYKHGKRVEFRYKAPRIEATATANDVALARGQMFTVGVSSASGDLAVPLSVRRAGLLATAATYAFVPKTALPPVGRALLVLPAAATTLTPSVTHAGGTGGSVSIEVPAIYTVQATADDQPPPNVSDDPAAIDVAERAPIELPFDLDLFREGWRGIVRVGGAFAATGNASSASSGLGTGSTLPSRTLPNGVVSALRGALAPSVEGGVWKGLVSGSPPARRLTVQGRGVLLKGSDSAKIDLTVVFVENGDVEYHFSGLTDPSAASLLGAQQFSYLENGNGDVAVVTPRGEGGLLIDTTKAATHVFFKRVP